MSFFVTKYPAGTFCWADAASTDVEATNTFMGKLMGWRVESMPTESGKPDYMMYYLGDKSVAGAGQMPPTMKGIPSFWNSYVSVDDVDEMAKKVVELGGKVVMPAMDVLDVGRMVGIQDPTGAALMLWQPKKHIGATVVNTVGAMVWNELYTKDVEKAKDFYGKLFGWTYEVDTKNNNYVMIKNNGRSNGGIFEMTPEMGAMPPNWTVYFTVKNIEESVKKVSELGGKIFMPIKEISVGKIAMVADPAGAAFMIMEMSIPPSDWQE